MKSAIELSALCVFSVLLLGCPAQQADTTASQAVAAKPAAAAPVTESAQPQAGAVPAAAVPALPTEINLPNGAVLAVVPVSKVDGNPQKYAGTVAISGQVLEADGAKGVLVLKDCPDASCATPAGSPPEDDCSCCAPAHMPLRLDPAAVEGTFPAVGDNVVVVAKLSPTATGYNLEVREIRSGDTLLLTVKPRVQG